jgi:hypothetical protein
MLARRSLWPSFFSRIFARLQWDATAIDPRPGRLRVAPAAGRRRRRLATLLPGMLGAGQVSALFAFACLRSDASVTCYRSGSRDMKFRVIRG